MNKRFGRLRFSRMGLASLGVGLLALLLVFSLKLDKVFAAPQEKAQQEKSSQERVDDSSPALTIYNQNFFVARERVPLDLKPGVNEAQNTGVASHLEPDSVILRDPSGRALQILEQNYRNDPISQELLLSFYEGKTIEFLVQPNQKARLSILPSEEMPTAATSKSRAKLSAAVTFPPTTSTDIRSRPRRSRSST